MTRPVPPTRRTVLAALPAVALAPAGALASVTAALPAPAPAAQADPHVAWCSEWIALRDAYDGHAFLDDEAQTRAWEQLTALGRQIALTPAATAAGAAAQLHYAIEDFGPHIFGGVVDDLDEWALRNALETLRRLA